MLTFPNAKINLGLHVTEKRPDGYHNIETVFYPVDWKDMMEIIPAEKKLNRKSEVQFRSGGIKITGGAQNNSCVKAYELLKDKFNLPPVQMYLFKLIPAGAGLGGGSADAAFTLITLNKIFNLKLTDEELEEYASSAGADCAFFIRNHPVFASEKGDKFQDIQVDLSSYDIVIVKPDVHVNTALAYKNIVPKLPEISLPDVMKKPVSEWKEFLTNDFEKTVFKKYPAINHVKDLLYDSGALYASMSGSGSAVYGIFEDAPYLADKFSGYHFHLQKKTTDSHNR